MSRHPDYAFVARRRRSTLAATTAAALWFIACVELAATYPVLWIIAAVLGMIVFGGIIVIDELNETLRRLDKGWDK